VPRYIEETKEKGERFTQEHGCTETISLFRDRNISIKYAVDVIHYFSHLIRANKSWNTQFINVAKMLEALLVVADYPFLASG